MKRIFALVLTVIMALAALAGCNSEGTLFDGFATADYIRISSGENSIKPIGYLTWANIDNGVGGHTETVFDKYDVVDVVSGKTDLPVAEISRLVLDGSVTYFVQVNGKVEKVYLITPGETEYTKSETTFEALSDLADGTYYVAVQVLLAGNCDPDSPQHSYRYEAVFSLAVGRTSELKMYRYAWDGWGISGKTVVPCQTTDDIINALRNMKETGETVPKISNEVFELGSGGCKAERGTMWIEYEDKIYRLTPDLSQICLVETHFGEGRVLELTDKLKQDIANAWQYVPYDYYRGTYTLGDKTVELEKVFTSGSSIQMKVKKIHVEAEHHPKNTITVELVSSVDREVMVVLRCQQSSDNLAEGDQKLVKLKKGERTTVELNFGGWPSYNYRVYIEAGSTKAEIEIDM